MFPQAVIEVVAYAVDDLAGFKVIVRQIFTEEGMFEQFICPDQQTLRSFVTELASSIGLLLDERI